MKLLGLRPTDQSCHHEAWLHLDFVGRHDFQPQREEHDQRILLKERSSPYHYGKKRGRISDIMSDRATYNKGFCVRFRQVTPFLADACVSFIPVVNHPHCMHDHPNTACHTKKTHKHTKTHANTHRHTNTHMNTYKHTQTHELHINTYTNTHKHTKETNKNTHRNTQIHTQTHKRTHTHEL